MKSNKDILMAVVLVVFVMLLTYNFHRELDRQELMLKDCWQESRNLEIQLQEMKAQVKFLEDLTEDLTLQVSDLEEKQEELSIFGFKF